MLKCFFFHMRYFHRFNLCILNLIKAFDMNTFSTFKSNKPQVDIWLLGCCTLFSPTVIKYSFQLANMMISPVQPAHHLPLLSTPLLLPNKSLRQWPINLCTDDDTQNYLICRIQLVVEPFGNSTYWTNQSKFSRSLQSC